MLIVRIVSNSKNIVTTEVSQRICYGHRLKFAVEAEFALGLEGKEMSNFLQFLSIYWNIFSRHVDLKVKL